MKRIKTVNRAVDLFGPGKDGFRAAQAGVSEPTYLSADFFNDVQESLVRVVERAGLVPGDNHEQFADAVQVFSNTAVVSMQLVDYTALRAYDGVQTSAYITGLTGAAAPSGIAGMFVRDDSDSASLDDGGTVIVAANGKRWKRSFKGAVNIQWFGGASDGEVDNTGPLQRLRAAGHQQIHFPTTPGTSNVYRFGGALTSGLTNGVSIDVDPGVTINVLDIGYLHPEMAVVRKTKLFLSALGNDDCLFPQIARQAADRSIWLSHGDREDGRVYPVYCNADLIFREVTSGEDVFRSFSPTFASVSGVVLPIANATDYRMAFRKVLPGDADSAIFQEATSATPIAMVRTATSYYGIAANTSDVAQPQSFAKSLSGGISYTSLTYDGQGTHASYSSFKSLWTVRINDVRQFSILLNGMVIHTVNTDDEILEAGFGGQGTPSGQITIQDWTYTSKRQQAGAKSEDWAIFGDSLTADSFPGSWPSQLISILDAFCGLRVKHVRNYAVPGDSSAQQRLLCTPGNIASYSRVLILIGPNDIQNGVDADTYGANLGAMIDTVQAAGKQLAVGLPTMFYGRDQAGGGRGQATQRYDQGKAIRAKCLRVCADKHVLVANTLEHLGPILGDWINPELGSVAALGRDPMVIDSIHHGGFGKSLLAKAFAAVIIGDLMRVPTLATKPNLLPAANVSGGWTFGSGEPGEWVRSSEGLGFLFGLMNRGASIANGTVVYTLPENLRARRTRRYEVASSAGSFWLNVDGPTGQMSLQDFPATATWLSLDGICLDTR